MSLAKVSIGDVIQFNEKHNLRGALAIVTNLYVVDNDVEVIAGVPIVAGGEVDDTLFVHSMQKDEEFEAVGRAALLLPSVEEEEELAEEPAEEEPVEEPVEEEPTEE